MALFFNGRQWISPAVMSAIDDSKMYGRKPSDGNNLGLIGRSLGGKPLTPLKFGSASEAKAVLRDGDLLRAVERCFSASSESPGPSYITVVRVNPSTQSSLMLKDASAGDSIQLISSNYGLVDNQIKVKVEAGTNSGLRLTTQFGLALNSADDIARRCFTIRYDGTGAGTISVTNTAIILTLNSVVTTTDLDAFLTNQEVVDRLNAVVGISAVVQDGHGSKVARNSLDGVSGQDIKTAAFTVTGTLQAAIDWFNSVGEGFVSASRPPAATRVPSPANFAYLSGATDGVVTYQEWDDAFAALQTTDVQWVVPLTGMDAIHSMADAHCHYMSNIARKERRCIVGTVSGVTDANAIVAAKNLNSDRTSLTHLGVYDYDGYGQLVLFEPYFAAAIIAAAFAGLNPGTPMTNKSINISGTERKLRNPTDTDDLINGGVLCIEDASSGYRVVQSISTWLTNDNYNRREVSVGFACDFVMRKVRGALDQFRGAKNNPQALALAASIVDTTLAELARPEPMGPGVLAGDSANPAYKNISVSQEGDILRVEFQASPVIPINYVPITVFAVPYKGSV